MIYIILYYIISGLLRHGEAVVVHEHHPQPARRQQPRQARLAL